MFVCSPNNPTGNAVPREVLLELARKLEGRALLVVDEAYVEFSAVPSVAVDIAELPNLLVLRTLSKSHGLAGARCGALLAAPEIIALAVAGLEAAGLPRGTAALKINNRKLLNGLLDATGVTAAGQKLAVLRAVDKLDRLGPDGVRLLLGEGRKDESGAFTRGAGLAAKSAEAVLQFVAAGGGTRSQTLERLAGVIGGSAEGDAGLEDLARIDAALTGLGVADDQALFEPSIVRGLEYYTGAVFEAEILLDTVDERGERVRFGSIGGGGRYDDLVARFTGEPVPATGFSFGVSRLAAALRAAGQAAADAVRGPVVVIVFDGAHMPQYFQVAG